MPRILTAPSLLRHYLAMAVDQQNAFMIALRQERNKSSQRLYKAKLRAARRVFGLTSKGGPWRSTKLNRKEHTAEEWLAHIREQERVYYYRRRARWAAQNLNSKGQPYQKRRLSPAARAKMEYMKIKTEIEDSKNLCLTEKKQ